MNVKKKIWILLSIPLIGCGGQSEEQQEANSNTEVVSAINDTGILFCANSNTQFLDCNSTNLGSFYGLNQDGELGRDVLAANGKLTKVGGGQAGFDFSKISNSGTVLPANASNWSCVLDNNTGLIWEVKTDDGGLRDKDNTYKWYNPNGNVNGGFEGYNNNGLNTYDFIKNINNQSLCGYRNWRLPTKVELANLVNYGKSSFMIDEAYFPNTQSSWYATSSPLASSKDIVWVVLFNSGGVALVDKNVSTYIRSVTTK